MTERIQRVFHVSTIQYPLHGRAQATSHIISYSCSHSPSARASCILRYTDSHTLQTFALHSRTKRARGVGILHFNKYMIKEATTCMALVAFMHPCVLVAVM